MSLFGDKLSADIEVSSMSHENYVDGLNRCEELAGEEHQIVLWLNTNHWIPTGR